MRKDRKRSKQVAAAREKYHFYGLALNYQMSRKPEKSEKL
jgi:hypothetical protein